MNDLSPTERLRIVKVIAAVKAADWETFASLSEESFSNTEAMRDQFEDSSKVLRRVTGEPVLECRVGDTGNGTRLIETKIMLDEPDERPITFLLHSSSAGRQSRFGIWAFYQEIDLDDLN